MNNNIDFKKIVEAAGIPTTEAGWTAVFKQLVIDEGSMIANDSKYSPFWRLLTAIVSKPATWIVNKVLIERVLPNMFLLTATDNAFVDAKAWEHDIERKAANKLRGELVFYRASKTGPGLLIPAGTEVQTDAINGKVYTVLTLTDCIMPADATTATVEVEAQSVGAAYNLGEGYYHILPKAVTGIGAVTNLADWIVVPGADEETNDDLKLRTRNAFTAAAGWHIDAVYRKILTERAGLDNDNIYFEHEAPRGPGTANAYILLDTGEPSNELISDLNEHIMARGFHGHGDDLLVLAMPNTEHDIACTIYFKSTVLETEINTSLPLIEDLIRCAFRENRNFSDITITQPNGRFSWSKLGQELHRNFDVIDSIEWQQSDIHSAMNVPRLSSLTVTKGL